MIIYINDNSGGKFMSIKIAVLMLVHRNEDQVNKLVDYLSRDFDIYMHIDKRSNLHIKPKDNIFVFKKYKVYWCSFNIIKATLHILQAAYQKKYDRYVLLSGMDLPIKTNKEILEFFEKNRDIEYIHNEKVPTSFWEGRGFERLTEYYPNILSRERNSIILKRIDKINNKIFKFISKIKKRPIDYVFYGGSQWFNITNDCVKKIFEYLEEDKKYMKRYEYTHTSDELFFQTIICNIPELKIINDPLRYIDFGTGPEHPRVMREEDYKQLVESDALFARKFDPSIDIKIIELIYERISKSSANCT
jgi:hypothetical protein